MYARITHIRSLLYDKGIFKASEFDFPIINVGNLAVGGSGKTPHIEYLIRLLKDTFKLATLSRGYGRTTRGFREVLSADKASESGDEPLQLKQKFPSIAVFVGEDRVEAITKLLFLKPETEVILLDDAYQHRAIKAGMNILLSEHSLIFTRDKSMPVGRLREYPSAAKRANMVIITKCPDSMDKQEKLSIKQEIKEFTSAPVLFSKINYDTLIPFSKTTEDKPTKANNIMVVSGIANPTPMLDYIKDKFMPTEMEHIAFRDHHRYSSKDIVSIIEKFNSFASQNKFIVISEKDALRLREITQGTAFMDLPVFILPIKISFLDNDKTIFNENIISYVRENTENH